MIHLGGTRRSQNPLTAFGIAVRAVTGRLIAHNTVTASPTTGTPGAVDKQAYFIDVAVSEKQARVINNLLLGTASGSEFGVSVRPCTRTRRPAARSAAERRYQSPSRSG